MKKAKQRLLSVLGLFSLGTIFWGLYAQTPPEIPETPAGKTLKASLEVINSGDMEAIRNYIANNFTRKFVGMFGEENLFNVYYGFSEKYQGLDFHHAEDSSPTKITGVHRCRLTGSGFLFGVSVEDKPSHKIKGMTILPLADVNPSGQKKNLNDAEISKQLEQFIGKMGENEVFSGVALVAKKGKILLHKASGWADRKNQIPNRIETKFNLASLTKMFTAVAVAQLVEKGKIAFEDPIGKYLDDGWIPPKVGKQVKVKHLLSHTSGIRGGDDNLVYIEEAEKRGFRKIGDYRLFAKDANLKFKPGSKHLYSNMGFHLLGVIIEKVARESYSDYLKSHIFKPAGMANTILGELDGLLPDMAFGYKKVYKDGKFVWEEKVFKSLIRATPAGGGYSTAEDLYKFQKALEDSTLVSRETRDILFMAKKELNAPVYGFGFSVRSFGNQRIIGHSGGYVGINNEFNMYPDVSLTIILLSNIDIISGSADSDIKFFTTSLLGINPR